MDHKSTRRRPTATIVCLGIFLVAAVLPLGARRSQAAVELVWVRQDSPVININNDPTFYEAPAGDRFEGSFWEYIVAETAITYEQRYVDHSYEWYHIILRSEFVRPPLVINPPLRYQLTAHASHSATKAEGAEGVGFQFWYNSDYATIDPDEVLAYYPWSQYFTGVANKEWIVSAPEPRQSGDTFELYASWWNCPPCNITWTYVAEPANEVEQLGAEVVAPVVTYQGEEVAPGETFFPGTCALPDGRSVPCDYTIGLADKGAIEFTCVLLEKHDQLLLILEMLDVPIQQQEGFYLSLWQHKERCGLNGQRGEGDYQIGLVLQEGGLLLEDVAADQKTSVTTELGTATASRRGAFAVTFQPDSRLADFLAFSAPLTIQPVTGQPLSLQPGQQVRLTATGFNPVTPLRQVYLPVTIR